MKDALRLKCDLFVQNHKLMLQGFTWDYPILQELTAILCTAYNETVDIHNISSCKRVIRNNMAGFSYVSESALLPTATIMALAPNSEKIFGKLKTVYQMLLQEGFQPSVYLMLSSVIIAMYRKRDEFLDIAKNAKIFYARLINEDWFRALNKEQDYAEMTAIWYAYIGEADKYIENGKQCYKFLKDKLPVRNIVHVIHNNLLMNSLEIEQQCNELLAVYDAMESRGHCVRNGFEDLPLTVLALGFGDDKDVVDEVLKVCDYLQNQTELKYCNIPEARYLLYAAAILEVFYIDSLTSGVCRTKKCGEEFIAMNTALIMSMADDVRRY